MSQDLSKTAQADVHNQVLIAGRIAESTPIKRRDGTDGYVTIINLPSADQYSRSETVEVLSSKLIGHKGEETKVPARVGGYRRKIDGKEGRPDWYRTDLRLEAVD